MSWSLAHDPAAVAKPAPPRLRRRLLSVGALHLSAASWLAVLPAVILAVVLVDLVLRSRLSRARFCLFIGWWCVVELLAWWAAATCGLVLRGQRLLDVDYVLQRWWSTALWTGLVRLYGLDIQVEGLDCVLPGPIVLLVRHASTADTLVPAVMIANPNRLRLRYLLKRELLWDPCIDMVGQRLPNHFVDRHPRTDRERRAQLDAIGRLAQGLDAGSGVVIYPEGTRFSPGRRQRRLDRARQAGDDAEVARVERFTRVFPPHPAGLLRVLQEAPSADLVFCAHTGFESVTRLPDLWRGTLVGAPIRMKLWRVPRAELPAADDACTEWLTKQWQAVEAFVAQA